MNNEQIVSLLNEWNNTVVEYLSLIKEAANQTISEKVAKAIWERVAILQDVAKQLEDLQLEELGVRPNAPKHILHSFFSPKTLKKMKSSTIVLRK